MEDFFKQFRDNLEGRPEPEFEERDWQDMQARLEGDGLKRPAGFAWWWMAVPFMFLLTASNAFFFWQWRKADKQVSSLELRHDTVFHTRVVYTTDTIYRTRVIRERVVEYPIAYTQRRSNVLENASGLRNLGIGKDLKSGENYADSLNQNSGNGNVTQILPKGEQAKEDQPIEQNTSPLPLKGIHSVKFPQRTLDLAYCQASIPAQKRKKSLADHLYTVRPKGCQLGASGGLAYPFEVGVDFKSGYSVGVHGALEFSQSLRLWADAAYFKTLFLTDRMGYDIGVPPEAPPSNDYVFLQAEVPQPFVQCAKPPGRLCQPEVCLPPR